MCTTVAIRNGLTERPMAIIDSRTQSEPVLIAKKTRHTRRSSLHGDVSLVKALSRFVSIPKSLTVVHIFPRRSMRLSWMCPSWSNTGSKSESKNSIEF